MGKSISSTATVLMKTTNLITNGNMWAFNLVDSEHVLSFVIKSKAQTENIFYKHFAHNQNCLIFISIFTADSSIVIKNSQNATYYYEKKSPRNAVSCLSDG